MPVTHKVTGTFFLLFKIIYYFRGKAAVFLLFFFVFLISVYGKLSYFCGKIET